MKIKTLVLSLAALLATQNVTAVERIDVIGQKTERMRTLYPWDGGNSSSSAGVGGGGGGGGTSTTSKQKTDEEKKKKCLAGIDSKGTCVADRKYTISQLHHACIGASGILGIAVGSMSLGAGGASGIVAAAACNMAKEADMHTVGSYCSSKIANQKKACAKA
ncbi:hypothetical protein [Pseudoalteromonas maricaloris]|uniref:hypothetical protein n=1 Tax=Pseudoalteromonas maricaloris TaxID=184924 RepID=UPI00029A7D2F|nr:hypothetical protein [Pseudoalteromonas flavipulchra]